MFFKEFLSATSKIGWRNIHLNNDGVLGKNPRVITSGIIVTGDEILKGQSEDTNSHFLCRKLFEMGIKVVRVLRIPDNVDKISEEVKKFSKRYDYVLTTGGIGPTHDDITYEAVAKAFDDKLILHPELSKLVSEMYKITDPDHTAFKMARIPSKAKLVHGIHPETKLRTLYPNVSVNNVFMFPGVPHYCEIIFESTKTKLFTKFVKFYQENIYLTCTEAVFVDILNSAVEKYPGVLFGSYPKFFDIYFSVKVSLESICENELKAALNYLTSTIPAEYQIDFDENPFENKEEKFLKKFNYGVYKEAVFLLKDLLQKVEEKSIFFYFDGGKNSTALLHLLSIVYNPKNSIKCVYVELNPRVTSYVTNVAKCYNINLLRVPEENFSEIAESTSDKFIFIKGTRDSDPNSVYITEYFDRFNILNPMKNWRYADVWTFIRGLCLPYCELYDLGYSSITNKNATCNPNLIIKDSSSQSIIYKKAFELTDESLENAS